MMKKTQSQKAHKNLTSLFLAKDKRQQLCDLLKAVKTQYKSYDKDNVKRARLKVFAEDMWNALQNEFFHTCDISDNSIWKWQDDLKNFDEYGYLIERKPEELSDWSVLIKGWYKREWSVEVLNLIKDFNLDNREPEFTSVFKDDFRHVKNQEQFVSAIYKWTDLIYWSPWKLALLESKIPQPRSVHYEDDYNPDVDEVEFDF